MTHADSGAEVTCLVCGGTLSLERALAGEVCGICGRADWDPPLAQPQPEPARDHEETAPPPDGQVGPPGEADSTVPPHLPSRRTRWAKPLLIVVILMVVGVVIQQILATGGGASRQPTSAPTSGAGTNPSPKKGQWVLVLESLPKKTKSQQEAHSVASRLATSRSTAVLDSSRVPGLRAGYWAVVALPFSDSKNAATSGCRDFGRKVGASCYAREVR